MELTPRVEGEGASVSLVAIRLRSWLRMSVAGGDLCPYSSLNWSWTAVWRISSFHLREMRTVSPYDHFTERAVKTHSHAAFPRY